MFLSVGSNGPSESSLRVLSDRIDSAQDLEVLNYTLNEIKQFASLPELAQSAYSSLIENLKSKKLPEQQVQIIICALNFTGPHDALKEFCLASNNPSDLIVTLRRRLSTSEHNQSPAATHGINLLTALANCADENCAASDSAQKALIRFALGKTTKSFTLAGQQAGIWLAQQLTAQSWTVLADLHSEVRTDPTGHLTLVPAQNKNAAEAKANRIHFEESFKDLSQAAYKNNCTELAYTLITLGVPQAKNVSTSLQNLRYRVAPHQSEIYLS